MLGDRGIREAATPAGMDLVRSAWSEHWHYMAGRDRACLSGLRQDHQPALRGQL
jgi:hypothetical protein